MKKKPAIYLTVLGSGIVLLFLLIFTGPGFLKNPYANMNDYSISEDGRFITINVDTASSATFIRRASVSQQYGGKLYIDFYSAFGGLHGHIGAKTSFTLPLDEDTELIALYRDKNCYQEVMRKDSNGVWQFRE